MTKLHDVIFRRKSIRKYNMNPLPDDTLEAVKHYVNNIEPLIKGIKVEFGYLSSGDVRNLLPIKAPHYLCIYSEEAENYLMNAGYMLQQADLYLSSQGIGSCWLGMAKPNQNVPGQLNGLDFVIMLAFGNSPEPVHRRDLSEFKRKNMDEIRNARGADNILASACFAPSASNSQPWFFTGNAERINVYREKLGMIKAVIYDKMNQIDIGIALCHIFVAAKAAGKDPRLIFDEEGLMAPKGYQYMTSVVMEPSEADK